MTSYYTDLPFMACSSCSYCMDLPFLVDSIDSSAVCGQLQFFRSMQLSSLYWLCAAYDGFSLKSLHKQWPKQCSSFLLLSKLICLRLQASLIFVVFPRSASVGTCYLSFSRADSQEQASRLLLNCKIL